MTVFVQSGCIKRFICFRKFTQKSKFGVSISRSGKTELQQQMGLIFTGHYICTAAHCQGLMYSMFSLQHIIVRKQTIYARSESGCIVFRCSILLPFPAALKAPLVFMFKMMPVFGPLIWLQHSHFKFICSLTLKLFSVCLSLQSPDAETLNQLAVAKQ